MLAAALDASEERSFVKQLPALLILEADATHGHHYMRRLRPSTTFQYLTHTLGICV